MIPKELQGATPLTGDQRLERESEYLGAVDFVKGASATVTIKNAYHTQVTLARGKEYKNLLTFEEERVDGIIGVVRPLILNETNRKMLISMFGDVTANILRGKKIQLYIQGGIRNPSKSELGDGIRIRKAEYRAPVCEECGKEIAGLTGFAPEQIAVTNRKRYGRALCVACGQKRKAEIEAEKAAVEAERDAKMAKVNQVLSESVSEGVAEDGKEKDMQAVLAALRGE